MQGKPDGTLTADPEPTETTVPSFLSLSALEGSRMPEDVFSSGLSSLMRTRSPAGATVENCNIVPFTIKKDCRVSVKGTRAEVRMFADLALLGRTACTGSAYATLEVLKRGQVLVKGTFARKDFRQRGAAWRCRGGVPRQRHRREHTLDGSGVDVALAITLRRHALRTARRLGASVAMVEPSCVLCSCRPTNGGLQPALQLLRTRVIHLSQDFCLLYV